MNVKTLIELLQSADPETEVIIDTIEGGFKPKAVTVQNETAIIETD